MSLSILRAGAQTTLQGGPRTGWRHMGVPSSGAADCLSLALANRLVGRPPDATTLEITLGNFAIRFDMPIAFALTGAPASAALSGQTVQYHQTYHASAGDTLEIGPPDLGCRTYLAVSATLEADSFLDSQSTYLPAGFGGYEGRALKSGDSIAVRDVDDQVNSLATPPELIPPLSNTIAVQACTGLDFEMLTSGAQASIFRDTFTISQRCSRMGAELTQQLELRKAPRRFDSVAVFPGTLQCPPHGQPFLLMADAQTTGGYPYILQVIRADLPLLGQIGPGTRVLFLKRTPEQAVETLAAKRRLYENWISGAVF